MNYFYRDLSEFSHGTDIIHNNIKVLSETHIGLIALRDVSDVKNLVDTAILILEKSIFIFLQAKVSDINKFKLKGFELVSSAKKLREYEFKFEEHGQERISEWTQ